MLSVDKQLEELVLIRSSFFFGERLEFLGSDAETIKWGTLVDKEGVIGIEPQGEDVREGLSAAHFRVSVDGGVPVWFDINFQGYSSDDYGSVNGCVQIGGEGLSRAEHEKWRRRIKEKVEEVAETGGEFPMYQLLSLHLLPLLHEETQRADAAKVTAHETLAQPADEPIYHVLFKSHHIISSTKRRNLQHWSSSLKISGFAKVGYPGVIYAQGSKGCIEEFVSNVKAMQWLALKVRFVEPLEGAHRDVGENGEGLRGWREFEKMGEVVEQMRKLNQDKYVREMGIGAGKET